jgi:uncharacterized membrane protein
MQHYSGPNISTAAGLLIALMGVLLIRGALPPNRWLGLRTRRTAASCSDWYRAHRAMGWVIAALGLTISALSLWPTFPVHPATPLICVLVVAAAIIYVYRRYAA